MRITFVLPYAGASGGIRVVAIHAERLRRRGHDVTVVSTAKPVHGRMERGRAALKRAFDSRPAVDESYFASAGVAHRVLPHMGPVVDADVPDADVVIATWWRTAEWVGALSPTKGTKIHFVQGHEVFPEQPIERVRAAYRLPIAKITIARWLVDVLKNEYGFADVPLVPNAVDHDVFHAPPRGRQPRPTLGFLYNRDRVKGFDVLLKAVGRIAAETKGLRTVVFGTSDPGDALPASNDAEFVLNPPQDKIRGIYSGLDLWICGSRSEGFHLMPLEAMACRTPVVSTRVGGAVETVRDGVSGWLVDVEDDAALAERSIEILNLPDAQWRRFSEGAAAVAAEFSWDRSTELLERAILDVVVRRRPAAR